MQGRIRNRLAVLFILLVNTQTTNAACVDPTQLARSAVSIMRYFDDAEHDARPDLIGIRGTGSFLSPTTILSAEHVTAAMKLSTEDWKPLEIVNGDGSQFIAARIQRLAGSQADKLAVIELQRPVSNVRSVAIRREPLAPDEQVIALAYPAGRPQLVGGRFVRIEEDDSKLAGMALLELYEGENRLVIDHGASGAPVVDCAGRVVAVVSFVFTQTIAGFSHPIRVSTAWGMPNVVSVPASTLEDSPQTH
jgi:Trypsin-like peptidase domain